MLLFSSMSTGDMILNWHHRREVHFPGHRFYACLSALWVWSYIQFKVQETKWKSDHTAWSCVKWHRGDGESLSHRRQDASKVITEGAFRKFGPLFSYKISINGLQCGWLTVMDVKVVEGLRSLARSKEWRKERKLPSESKAKLSEGKSIPLCNINLEQVHLTGNEAANKSFISTAQSTWLLSALPLIRSMSETHEVNSCCYPKNMDRIFLSNNSSWCTCQGFTVSLPFKIRQYANIICC